MPVRSSAAVPWDRLLAFADKPRRLGPLFIVQAFFGGGLDLVAWLMAAGTLGFFAWSRSPAWIGAMTLAGTFIVIALDWPRRVKALTLAQRGRVTTARLLSYVWLPAPFWNKHPTPRCIFAYSVNGVALQLTVKGGDPTHIVDDDLEVLFYDAENPERAALLDTIPGTPKLLPDGTFSAGKDAVLSLVPPLCFVAALVAFWLRAS